MLATLRDVLPLAQEKGYAVGLFNTTDTDMLEAAISAAEEMRAPLIIGTAEILLPYGELKLIAPALLAAAKRATVPVVVHYDHGLTLERCREALELGFTSIMLDGSTKTYDENVEMTRKAVAMAKEFGASVEGEIGHVGNAADMDEMDDSGYTTDEEAIRFVADTGVDALAVAIGTAHGAYKRKPKLSLERLRSLKKAVSVPLVLHGGSGLSDDDFRNAISDGIAKVNIFTDLCVAGMKACREATEQGEDYLTARNHKVASIRKAVQEKMRLFSCAGKA